MARVSRAASTTTRSATTRTTASRTAAAGPPVEMTFKHIEKGGGHEITFDLDVRGGSATDLEIVSPFMQDRVLYREDLLTPATNEMRGVRISTDRPVFVFSNAGGVLLSVQVDLSSEKPRVVGTENLGVRVR